MITLYINTASSPGGNGTTNATSGDSRAFSGIAEANTYILNNRGTTINVDDVTVYCCGEQADILTAPLSMAVADNNAQKWLTYKANPNHPNGAHYGYYRDDRYRIFFNYNMTTYGLSLNNDDNYPVYLSFDHIQMVAPSGYGRIIQFLGRRPGWLVYYCIIISTSTHATGHTGLYVSSPTDDRGWGVTNDSIYKTCKAYGVYDDGGSYFGILNCVFDTCGGSSSAAIRYRNNSTASYVKNIANNIIVGAPSKDIDFVLGSSVDYFGNNAGQRIGELGSNGVAISNWSNEFVISTLYSQKTDYRLSKQSSLLNPAGKGPTSMSWPSSLTTDIRGNSRTGSTCSIGACEKYAVKNTGFSVVTIG